MGPRRYEVENFRSGRSSNVTAVAERFLGMLEMMAPFKYLLQSSLVGS